MEAQNLTSIRQLTIPHRLLSAVVPVLFVAVSYVDPGKWAAAVEGGPRFGLAFILLLLMFSFAAIFCHYLSARIAVVSTRNLAEVCSVEYDSITCIVLGAQAELSMLGLDLMMVVGTAHGLNVLFGIDLFTGVLLTAVNTLVLPLYSVLLEDGKVNLLAVCFSVVILFFYFFEVFLGQPRDPPSLDGISARLNGESIFALMSLLGSNIMPHNFYLHSSLIQQVSRPGDVAKGDLCHDHLFAIFGIFSGIFLVHYELMSSAATEPSSLSTFQDVLDQVFRSSIAPLALIALMFFSNQVMAVSWNHGGQAVSHNMLKLELPGWLHHATIRILAIIPALCCSWSSGAEGIYQLLILTQVMIALMLPTSVIPLFRVASSSSIMGIHKISRFEEFLALVTFVGMLGLNVLFFMELMFGNTEWANNLWDTGSSVPIAYVILVVSASVSFCLMLWLVATPLKSVSSRINAQVYDWSGDIMQSSEFESFVSREQNNLSASEDLAEGIEKLDPGMEPVNSLGSFLDLSTSTANLNLPDSLYDSEDVGQLATIDEKVSEVTFPVSSTICNIEGSAANLGDTYLDSNSHATGSKIEDALMLSNKSVDSVERTSIVDGDSQESSKDDNESTVPDTANQSLASEGPGSFRSLGGRSDEPGSGTGSLSKLAGLGRAGRRQLTIILDEFWGQIFDFHGQVTAEASAKKLDMVLGLVCKVDAKSSSSSSSSSSVKMDNNRAKEFIGNFPSDPMITSSLYNSNQQMGQGTFGASSYGGMQRRPASSLWSSHLQPLDAYTGRNPLDYNERRYSSMRIPSSADRYDQQPATVHGYELASYLSQISNQREAMNNGQMEQLVPPAYTYSTQMSTERDSSPTLNGGQVDAFGPKSTSLTMPRYGDSVSGRPSIRRPLNSVSSLTPPGFEKVAVSRNSSLRLERSVFNTPSSPKPIGSSINNSVDAKKYHSLPDISGRRMPHQDSSPMFNQSRQWDNSLSTGPTFEQQRFSSGYHPSEVCKDAFSLQYSSGLSTGSMWSRQPYEQFGVADKSHIEGGEQQVNKSAQETAMDSEAKLLQSFRYCIMRILKLDGSEWLFKQNDGTDEDLIDRVAAREKFLYEAESSQILKQQNIAVGGSQSHLYSDRSKAPADAASPLKTTDDADYMKFLVTSVPHCGEGCVYKVDLIVSFGVWCIHRILELSLMESRPELWGKYTFVLNRLQGIMELAFFRARTTMTPCFCLQLPDGWQQRSSSPNTNGCMQLLPPHPKAAGQGKCTTAAMLVEIVKDVELAISCRKGRTGTAAGDVAFPKGKENLASVLKRYKRRLSSKSSGKAVSTTSSSQQR